MIMTYFMALGDRPVRSAEQRDMVLLGKRRDAAGRSPKATFGRDKFNAEGPHSMIGAIRLWCAAPRHEPLLAGGEFLAGETGHYQGPLVLVPTTGGPQSNEKGRPGGRPFGTRRDAG